MLSSSLGSEPFETISKLCCGHPHMDSLIYSSKAFDDHMAQVSSNTRHNVETVNSFCEGLVGTDGFSNFCSFFMTKQTHKKLKMDHTDFHYAVIKKESESETIRVPLIRLS